MAASFNPRDMNVGTEEEEETLCVLDACSFRHCGLDRYREAIHLGSVENGVAASQDGPARGCGQFRLFAGLVFGLDLYLHNGPVVFRGGALGHLDKSSPESYKMARQEL